MDNSVWLETNRLNIYNYSEDSFENTFKLLTNKKVNKHIFHFKEKRDVERNISLIRDHYKKYGYSVGEIFLKKDNTYIGRAGLYNVKVDDEENISLMYQLLPEYWLKGYAEEAVEAILNYAFNIIKCHKVIAFIKTDNLASKKLIQKFNPELAGKTIYLGIESYKYLILNWKN